MDQPVIAEIPKADLHMHAETRARLDRFVSKRNNEAPHNWAEELLAMTRRGIMASFTSDERKAVLLSLLRQASNGGMMA